MLFGADKVARDVLRTVDPVGMKRLVKHLPGYDRETWQAEAPKILHDAHIAKFTQNPSLRDALLDTGDTVIGEASRDSLFGIGFTLSHARVLDSSKWTGCNIQGCSLVTARQAIRDGTV